MIPSDAAFEVESADLAILFRECATALFRLMAELERMRPVETRALEMEDPSASMLLHRRLSDLIFLKDSESLIFSELKQEYPRPKAATSCDRS